MMNFSTLMVFVVAGLHAAFFLLESVFWTSPSVRRLFKNSQEDAETTRILAMNQGCYNLGLSIMLIAFQVTQNPMGVMGILLFLAAMGIVGGLTASREIILVQSLPAVAALIVVHLNSA